MLNSVVLMGRLTADPELKTTASDAKVTSFTLAVERNYSNKQNSEKITDFIDIVAWRSTADFVCRYFKKGQLIAVQGSIQIRSYEDKDGKKRRVYEVQADQVFFADKKANEESGYNGGYTPVPDDDLPFR